MARKPTALLVLACLAGACQAPPFGEVLVVADTDVSVPRLVGRLRVDLYTAEGSWYESRDVAAPSSADWPLSFSLVTDALADRDVRLRLRAYPESGVHDYRGEHFVAARPFIPPHVAQNLTELCVDAPTLAPGVDSTQRRGAEILTTPISQGDCNAASLAGSVAARVVIAQAGSYRFEVVRSFPDVSLGQGTAGDTTLFLRSVCNDRQAQLGCNDDLSPMDYNPRLLIDLQPGTYWVITGGALNSPADVTLRWSLASAWSTPAPPDGGTGEPLPSGEPRLRDLQGNDLTPALEPQPNLSIDRLADVHVVHGERRTLALTLHGECLGTMADLAGGRSCIDTAGTLAPVEAPAATDGIVHAGPSTSGTWSAEVPTDCTIAPRERHRGASGDELFDEEVCVPGGVVTLGDRRLVGFEDLVAAPEQIAVVEPLLVDKYELTVARYRQALLDGFVSPDVTPKVNPAFLDFAQGETCTWPGDTSGPEPFRERLPLSCISWYSARALCRFLGSDLPTAAEWEWAASGAGRDHEVAFPWGDDPPTPDCTRTVFGRVTLGGVGGECPAEARRPEPVDQLPWAQNDLTASGLVLMGGNVSEWTLDSDRSYADSCWWQRPLRGVGCVEDEATGRTTRGGSFIGHIVNLHAATNPGGAPVAVDAVGLRCVRRGRP